ncbi:Asp_protease_2 domain-containing protein [Cephalotus follicularis]|uniref:Asp_protease_2 domain-containing protein n=1 Tax=Cephalotus follicularis TaxID=3775 RepID=A0A1Q3CIW6_CEPFO|nr:Asp_protease_2 domain-containing protein [Cephalotus follicularis]
MGEKSNPTRSDKKCFKCHGYGHFQAECPNKRVMTLKEIEDIEAAPQEEESKVESSNDDVTLIVDPVNGELLVVRSALHAKLKTSDQRENIFQSRCSIKGRVCSLIIDSGSCTNVAATTLVEKLNLPTTPHPSPYNLQWLSDGNQLKVSQQVLLSFFIGNNYEAEVLCDVIPMDACHLLLGSPWQYDRSVKHDGRKTHIH